ncbi:MAG: hypothetical protein LBE59_00465 [Nevskiaceae bacterium]|jgi:hypothetical protein|nr:hypothetical protein [Nevskiaceae bacterium]
MNSPERTGIAAIIASACLVAASAGAQERAGEAISFGIKDGGVVWGGAFYAPNEDGWTLERKGAAVMITKGDLAASENSQIEAGVMKLDIPIQPMRKFLTNMERKVKLSYTRSPTFTLVEVSVTADPKRPEQCARAHLVLKRKPAPARPASGKSAPATPAPATPAPAGNAAGGISEQYALYCGLPNINELAGVEIKFHQSYAEANKDAAFQEKANRLFDSVILGQ